MRDPQYCPEPEVQRELRQVRARKEPMRVEALGPGQIGTRFEVRSASDRRYEVEVRDPAHPVNTCTCPDFRINGLGTCKHVETVLRRRLARSGGARAAFVYFDRVRATLALHPPDGRAVAAAFRGAFFESDGVFRGRTAADSERMLEAAARLPARTLAVGAEVQAEVERRRDEAAWARTAAALRRKVEAGTDPFRFLAAPLYPYQVQGVLHLLERRRAILGDEMGLGKTIQAIAAAAFLVREHGARRILVVCPASLKHQWVQEVRRFAGLEATVVEGFPRARHPLYQADSPFIVANYEQVFRDRRFLSSSDARWDVVILDEAQRIKNWRTRTSNAVKDLRERCRFAFVLTGTPLENNLEELYSVCQFIRPEVLGPLWQFHDRYYRLDEDGHTRGYRNLDELRSRLAGIYVRRTKESVALELPDRVVNRFYVTLTPEQRAVHDEYAQGVAMLVATMKRRALTEAERKRLSILLLLMRRACDDSVMARGRRGATPKLDELERILDDLVEEGGRKAIIFSEWTDMLDRVAERLALRRLGHVYLHGGVPPARRGDLCERFRRDPTCRVFLSTEAGGLGLNLQAASVVIHMDLPWNPARLEQRNGRAHRIGQRHTVQAITLVAKDSIEARIESLIEAKRDLFDAVFRPGATETDVDLPSLSGPMLTLLSELVTEVDVATVGKGRAAGGNGATIRHETPIGNGNGNGNGDGNHDGNGSARCREPAAPPREPVVPASRSERALRAALHLRDGGFGAESVVQASRAIVAALADLLGRHGVPVPPDPQVAAAVRRHLVPAALVPRTLLDGALSTLAWGQGFELEEAVPPALAGELLEEVSGVVRSLAQA